MQGVEVVRPYTQGTTFTTLVDTQNQLGHYFGFKVVPNGIFIGEDKTIRMVKQGFWVEEPTHTEAVERLLRAELDTVELVDRYFKGNQFEITDVERQLAQTKYRLGMEYAKQGRKEEALAELDEALLLDRDNFLIRKQRWYLRYPEKFSPTIDFDWQKEQIAIEREIEAVCGPEGCKLPTK